MNDDELRRQLERRAEGGRGDWVKRQLLPAVSSAMEARATERVAGRGLSPAGALAAVAAVVVLVVGIVIVRPPTTPPAQSPTSTTPVAGLAPVVAIERVGDFTLTLTASKPLFSPNEEPDLVATLRYDGTDAERPLSGAFNLIAAFGARQLDGPGVINAEFELPCMSHPMTRGGQVTRSFSDYAADQPMGPGRWEITAIADFVDGTSCQGERLRIETSVVIAIATPVAAATPAPNRTPDTGPVSNTATTETSQGPFTLTIRAERGRYLAGEPIAVDAVLAYGGPAERVELRGSGLFNGFDLEQLDGELRLNSIHFLPCLALSIERDRPERAAFQKSGGLDDEPPFDRAFFDDPELRLPAGRWQISVSSSFYFGDCGGELVSLRASVVIDVVDVGPVPSPTPPEDETPVGAVPCSESDVDFTDHSGNVESCAVIPWDAATHSTGVVNPGGSPAILELGWDAAACGEEERFDLDLYRRNPGWRNETANGYFAAAKTHVESGTGCLFWVEPPVHRVVRLQMRDPVAADMVELAVLGRSENAGVNTSAGAVWLNLTRQPHGDDPYSTGERVNLTATLHHDVASLPRLDYIGQGSQVMFGIEQLDGPIIVMPQWVGSDRRDFTLTDLPLTVPFSKMGGWSADDPLAEWYEDFFALPPDEIRLPPGTYLLSAWTQGTLLCCDEDFFAVRAVTVITVLP